MDINSLLSPDDTPTSTSTPSPRTTPIYHHHHHHHSDSQQQQQQERTKSKLQTSTTSGNPSTSSQHHSASTKSNAVFAMSMSPPDRPITASRRAASGIDTLADLASMQQHSQRVSGPNNPKTIRKHDTYEKQPTAQGERPSLESITRAHSGSRSSLDIHMEDAPMKIPQPRAFESNSLSDENLILIRQLASYLAENPNAFESHLRLIKILRYGLLSHVHATEESPEEQDPITYDLLPDLRQAREAMTTRFTMGEEAWVERLQDEMLLARTLEDCLHIVELFEKAVADEAGSTRLWTMFGDWEAALYSVSNPSDQSITQFHDGLNRWISLTDNDCLVIAEVFGRSQIVEVWKRGAENVKYNINDSHLVWNKYTELLQLELGSRHSREKINALRKHFLDRLQTPHSNWDETFQKFSTFTSRYDNKAYEETMVQTSRKAEPSKVMFAAREVFEIELARALGSEDKITAWTKLNEYLEWEITQSRKKKVPFFSFELANALYQRATLLFPSDANLWEDHLVFLEQESEFRQEHISTLALLGRACDHCPWSGKLWSLYIQAAERQKLNFADIGQIKHKATSTGLLDSTSMEDILTIHTAWCSFLRRRAFSKEATDEEEDVAEVGIRSAIEDMESLGRRKEGKDYKGDPQYRLERIYIKFLAQNRKFDLARAEWKKLTSRQGNFSEYWLRYYTWEMHFWSYELGKTGVPSAQYGPKEPTKVLQQAAKRAVKTDWPEKILETYLVHCQDYEDVAAIDTAMIVYRRSMKDVKKRRELEAAAQKQAEAEAKLYADEGIASLTNGYAVKRKWEEDDDALEQGVKKSKGIDDAELRGHKIEAQPEVKRDRENSTVIVRNLPVDTPENWVQHYLNDCGEIKSILLSTDDGIGTATATVEFRSHQDALAALTKDQRLFRNQPIQISLGTGTTLYITNFPPQADEAWIRDLFKAYGEIIDVRFPSLKYNSHRRFCYIQFTSSSQAQAATSLDNSKVDEDLKLVVKLSNPTQKDHRHGPQHEGREVYIKNLDWRTTDDELETLFETYGKVERVRIIRGRDGNSKGFAYVVFSTKEEADASLILSETKFKARIMSVSIADPNPTKRCTTTILSNKNALQSHNSASLTTTGDPPSPPSAHASSTTIDPERTARTIALFNIPDTINTARLQTLLSPYGEIEEISLRPHHQGAIIVFISATAAGTAALSMSGHEIAPGRKIRTGPISELYKQKADIKDTRPGVKKSTTNKPNQSKTAAATATATTSLKSASFMPNAGPIKRPGQAGTGRRGGLGQRRGVAISKGIGQGGTNEDPAEGKSNDEFRRMLVKSSEAGSETTAVGANIEVKR